MGGKRTLLLTIVQMESVVGLEAPAWGSRRPKCGRNPPREEHHALPSRNRLALDQIEKASPPLVLDPTPSPGGGDLQGPPLRRSNRSRSPSYTFPQLRTGVPVAPVRNQRRRGLLG